MNGIANQTFDEIPPPTGKPKRVPAVRGLAGKSAAAGVGLVGATKIADVLLRGLDRLDPGLSEMLGGDAVHWIAGAVILPALTFSVKNSKKIWHQRIVPAAKRKAVGIAEGVADNG